MLQRTFAVVDNSRTIYVDLDGTLIRNDLFQEAILRLVKENPLNVFRIVSWIFRGRAHAKSKVAELTMPSVDTLLFDETLVAYLREQKSQGRRIVLATAAPMLYAEEVANHLGIFDDVIATTDSQNLKGPGKLKAIQEHSGGGEFTYAGDCSADRPIWRAASSCIYVNAPAADVKEAKASDKAELVLSSQGSVWKAFLREMRPHQYAKNMLIFVPMLTSHTYFDPSVVSSCILAFLAFSLCASGVYFLNDLMDIDADRRHASKRRRPIASGDLSIPLALVGAAILPLLGIGLAVETLPVSFVLVLLTYYALTNAYTFYLKRVATADVMTLAVLYTIRVIAGGVAANIPLSFWLMIFSMFVFVSLAYLKRYVEVAALLKTAGEAPGRGYSVDDKETIFSLGVASITASVLVLALYIHSESVKAMYKSPLVLSALCLLMLFWGNRIWVAARRGEVDVDPVVYSIKDKGSWFVLLGFSLVVMVAKYF